MTTRLLSAMDNKEDEYLRKFRQLKWYWEWTHRFPNLYRRLKQERLEFAIQHSGKLLFKDRALALG
jgi:hypothetical protein